MMHWRDGGRRTEVTIQKWRYCASDWYPDEEGWRVGWLDGMMGMMGA